MLTSVTACVLCDFSAVTYETLCKNSVCWEEDEPEKGACVLCLWWGPVGLSSCDCQHAFLFAPFPQDRSTLIVALHCVPDAAGQKAVEPLYTEVYLENWWMRHVCGLLRKRAFLLEGPDSLTTYHSS